jgi:hypothetical protein
MAKHVSDGPDSKPSGHHVSLWVSAGFDCGVLLLHDEIRRTTIAKGAARTLRDYCT